MIKLICFILLNFVFSKLIWPQDLNFTHYLLTFSKHFGKRSKITFSSWGDLTSIVDIEPRRKCWVFINLKTSTLNCYEKSLLITLKECYASFFFLLYWAEISTLQHHLVSTYILTKCSYLMNISGYTEAKFDRAIELLAKYWWFILLRVNYDSAKKQLKGSEEWASVRGKGKQLHPAACYIFPLPGHKMCLWGTRNVIISSLKKAAKALPFL